jgi:AraC family transcriptional regulator
VWFCFRTNYLDVDAIGCVVLSLLRDIPDAFGPKFGAESGAVTWTQTSPNEITLQPSAVMALVLFTPQSEREIALNSDHKNVFFAPSGSLEIVPAQSDLFARWTVPKENLLVAFSPDKLSQLAGSEFQNEEVTFRPPKLGTIDQRILLLSKLLREEFKYRGSTNNMCFDTLISLFGIYLLRSYTSFSDLPTRAIRGGLSPKAWRSVTDYINANLSENLSVNSLAKVAGLSPSHFRQYCGQAPHQYVVSRRIALAQRLIKETDQPLGEIAKLSGFSSNSHLSTTMRRFLGVIPRDLRLNGSDD